jgi:hypothetical protein
VRPKQSHRGDVFNSNGSLFLATPEEEVREDTIFLFFSRRWPLSPGFSSGFIEKINLSIEKTVRMLFLHVHRKSSVQKSIAMIIVAIIFSLPLAILIYRSIGTIRS